jgi:hypothetical protein
MIEVIPGGDQRPGPQDVSVPGVRCVARPPGPAPVSFPVAGVEIACLARPHLIVLRRDARRTSSVGGRIDAAFHQAISDDGGWCTTGG